MSSESPPDHPRCSCAPLVRIIRFSPAPHHHQNRGHLGWIRAQIGPLIIDGISLRRTQNGTIAISFPSKKDKYQHEIPVVRPVDPETRHQIERQILAALRREAVL